MLILDVGTAYEVEAKVHSFSRCRLSNIMNRNPVLGNQCLIQQSVQSMPLVCHCCRVRILFDQGASSLQCELSSCDALLTLPRSSLSITGTTTRVITVDTDKPPITVIASGF